MNAYTFSQSKASKPTSSMSSSMTSSLNSMPPQAYTRDTLVKAINWLSSQPQAVRERATSADLVVSHYLQACRRAESQTEASLGRSISDPANANGETFREDLKTLAEGLRKQFEEPTAPPPIPSVTTSVTVPARSPSPSPAQAVTPPPGLEAGSPDRESLTWQVDARSLALAKTVQQRMNLGSEIEGLRLLITLGAERARELFP
jgi:hypothetical protein